MIVCTSIYMYTGMINRDFDNGDSEWLSAALKCSDELFKGVFEEVLDDCAAKFDNALLRKYVSVH